MPSEGTKIMSGDSSYKVTEVDPLLGRITVAVEDGRLLRLPKEKFEKTENSWKIKE
jgi:hypothetical protein